MLNTGALSKKTAQVVNIKTFRNAEKYDVTFLSMLIIASHKLYFDVLYSSATMTDYAPRDTTSTNANGVTVEDSFERDLKEMLSDGPNLDDLSSTVQTGNVQSMDFGTGQSRAHVPPSSLSGNSAMGSYGSSPSGPGKSFKFFFQFLHMSGQCSSSAFQTCFTCR